MKKFILPILAGLLLALTACDRTPPPPEHPNVILMVLDTLRADHLGAWGYQRDTSPNLDAFARENKMFTNAMTTAPWTPPSLATMFTGLQPTSHGMMPPNDRQEAKDNSARLHPDLETLAEVFAGRGYQTAGITPNPWITKAFGYDQGFQAYHFLLRARADTITSNAIEALDQLTKAKSPFFLYVHYLDPHDSYDPPGEFAKMYKGAVPGRFDYPEKMAEYLGLYDGEIRFMDGEIGRLFQYLKEKKLWDDLSIVIVGDHGEQFMERGDHTHGFKLFNEELRVPLMVKGPSGRKVKGRFVKTVSTIDLFPTLLDLANIEASREHPGLSLLNDSALLARRSVMSEIRRKYSQRAVTSLDGKKLIMEVPLEEDSTELEQSSERWKNPNLVGLFDFVADPGETKTVNDSAMYADLRAQLDLHLLDAKRRRLDAPPVAADVTDETIEQLKSLGYLK